jgi:methionyl-tRNA formyltransferase
MKIVFMGTPDFSVAALEALVAAGHDVVAVYTQPPRPAGRGQKETKSPVHLTAEKHNISVKTPKTLKDEDVQAEFADLGADLAVVAAYGLILPQAILDACSCLNIHASILPRWRGAAPIQRAILAGDKESGVTIMQMDAGLDTGDMLIWEKVTINDDMNAGQLHDELSIMGAKLIVKALEKADLARITQVGEATYAAKIKKEEAKIDWNKSIDEVSRQIRAFNPYPGAFLIHKNEKIKILAAKAVSNKTIKSQGVIVDNLFGISCVDGVVYPTMVQREGKKPMPVEDMLRGFQIPVGTIIS